MKKIVLFALLLSFFTANVFAQTYNISDNFIYDADCDISNIVVATDPFNFEFEFDATMQNPALFHQFSRQVSAVFSDASGNVLKTVDLGWGNITDRVYDIYETTLAGLPDGEIHMDIVVTYKHFINNPYTNPLTVYDNGTSACSITFTNTTQELVCTFEDVLCFTFEACDDVSLSLYTKLGFMRSNLNPPGGNYEYQWRIDPDVGLHYYVWGVDRVPIATGCATYSLTVTDLDTGCKYRASKRACGAIEIPQCFIGIPSGLEFTGVNIWGGYVLDWNDVLGAGSYQLEITLNDPDCCSNGNEVVIVTTSSFTQSTYTYYPKDVFATPCFSWRVIAHCPDGNGSSTSESTCLFGFQSEQEFDTRSTILDQEITIFPNPAVDVINVEATGLTSSNAEILIMDAQGKLILNTNVSVQGEHLQYTWNIPSEVSAGVYFIQIKDQTNVYTKKFLHIK